MKEIQDQELSFAEANRLLGREIAPGVWELLVRKMNYPDLRVDRERGVLVYPEFIPFVELFQESLKDLDRGKIDVRDCLECKRPHDVNVDEGIFVDREALEGFVCEICARELTAWDFFHRYLDR